MKKNQGKLALAILVLSFLTLSVTAISPIIAQMTEVFSDVPEGRIQLLVTVPSVMVLVFSALCGVLSRFLKEKVLIICGLLLYLLGGLGPFVCTEVNQMIVFRFLLGAGIGLVSPFSQSLICKWFSGETQKRLMGFQAAFVNIGSLICTLLVGVLSVWGWRRTFLCYLIGLPVLLLAILYIPCHREEQAPPSQEKNRPRMGSAVLRPAVLFDFVVSAFIALLIFSYFTNVSLVVTQKRIGGTGLTSIAVAVYYLAGVLSGLAFARIQKVFGKKLLEAATLCMCVGFLALAAAGNMPVVFLASMIMSIGYTLIIPCMILDFSGRIPASELTLANALYMCVQNIGIMSSTYAVNGLASVLHLSEPSQKMLLSAGLTFFIVIVCAVRRWISKENRSNK